MGATRNLATDPGVIATDGRAPSSLAEAERTTRDGKNAILRHPRAATVFLIDALRTCARPNARPFGVPLACAEA
ncbi:hypothetical protein GCM10010339_32010 [Streptomyces alanosinicus]|uniref:Uncharacterized protein n=1 Tax=Streptomyces alanosinicus TaxID=68171 RepID=A0A918YH15_9ACTN|nr:hypothetical protein GCM10010339_32010 [Streptomyces alanosinicus]